MYFLQKIHKYQIHSVLMGNTCFVRISKVGMLSSQHLELQLFYSLVSEGHNQLETKKKEIVFLREEASHCGKI